MINRLLLKVVPKGGGRSSLFNVALSQDVPFHQPQQQLSSAHVMVLPLFSFELHSFLHCHIGDNLWYVRYGFSARLG